MVWLNRREEVMVGEEEVEEEEVGQWSGSEDWSTGKGVGCVRRV